MYAAREVAAAIVQRLVGAGHIAAFAGGCVRDEILGREPKDYDVVTSARPDEVETLFPKTLPIGRAFGVIVVITATCKLKWRRCAATGSTAMDGDRNPSSS